MDIEHIRSSFHFRGKELSAFCDSFPFVLLFFSDVELCKRGFYGYFKEESVFHAFLTHSLSLFLLLCLPFIPVGKDVRGPLPVFSDADSRGRRQVCVTELCDGGARDDPESLVLRYTVLVELTREVIRCHFLELFLCALRLD
jgi:hypothetical protein